MKKRFIISLSIFILLLSSCAKKADNSAEKNLKTVKIAYLPITHALPVFELKDKYDCLDGYKIELVKYGSWPELMDALNTGRVDGASVLTQLAMKAASNGIPIKAVALGHKAGNVVIFSSKESTEDIKGKIFAIPHRLSSHNILINEVVKRYGLAIDDINIVELSPTEMPSALISGRIDGYCVAEPFGAKAVTLGAGNVLFDSEELWEDSMCCAFVLTQKFLSKEKETAEKVIRDYKQAGINLDENEKDLIASKYLNIEKDVADVSLKWIRYDDTEITQEIYDDLSDRIKEYGIMENIPSYQEFVY